MPERMKDNQYFFPNASRSIRSVPKFNSRQKKKLLPQSLTVFWGTKKPKKKHYIGTDKHIHVHHNEPKPRTI